MAELADAIDLGSIGNTVQVQVLLPALTFKALKSLKTGGFGAFVFLVIIDLVIVWSLWSLKT